MEKEEKSDMQIIMVFLALMDSVKPKLQMTKDIINELDANESDLVHIIENTEDREIMYKAVEAIHRVRTERRKYKNQVAALSVIQGYYQKNTDSVNQLKQMLGELRKTHSRLENWKYTVKSKTALEELLLLGEEPSKTLLAIFSANGEN